MKNKRKARTEPSLLRQLLDIHFEQAKRRKALRKLAQDEWSFDFLTEVVRKAARLDHKVVEVIIESKGGNKIIVRGYPEETSTLSADNDIFNRLDDNAAVDSFIREHAPRR